MFCSFFGFRNLSFWGDHDVQREWSYNENSYFVSCHSDSMIVHLYIVMMNCGSFESHF